MCIVLMDPDINFTASEKGDEISDDPSTRYLKTRAGKLRKKESKYLATWKHTENEVYTLFPF